MVGPGMEQQAGTPGDEHVAVRLELFSTSFCGACRQTRAVLDRAAALVPGATVVEHDLAFEPDLGESLGIIEVLALQGGGYVLAGFMVLLLIGSTERPDSTETSAVRLTADL